MHKKKVTTDKALILSVALIIIYTIVTEVQIFCDKIPDATLTVSFFAAFSFETGLCTFIHNQKKKREAAQALEPETENE